MIPGCIDPHVHAGPDLRPRKLTALELARLAASKGLAAIVLKNHYTSTVPLAATVTEAVPGIRVFGGLVLNEWVGGLNPAAAEVALKMGAAEIWLPTWSAENERAYRGRPGTGLKVIDDHGTLRQEVREIIRLVAAADRILGTGHLAPREILAVAREAQAAGLRKLLVTHPEIEFIRLPVTTQRELAAQGIRFERCYARWPPFVFDWDGLAREIREVGVDSTILASDLGQAENPDPVQGFAQMLEELSQRGFTARELDIMARRNASEWLGLE